MTGRLYPITGILGGAGPAACVAFQQALIKSVQTRLHPVCDEDYPPTLVYNVPVPGLDVSGAISDLDAVRRWFVRGADWLSAQGASIMAIVCNSLHPYLSQWTLDYSGIRFVDLVTATVDRCDNGPVAVMASHSAYTYWVDTLQSANKTVVPITAAQQDTVTALIDMAIQGHHGPQAVYSSRQLARAVRAAGARTLILGCTDLSKFGGADHYLGMTVLDSVLVGADNIVDLLTEQLFEAVEASPSS